MFRFVSKFLAYATVIAVGAAGCSGNRSILPAAAPQGAGSNARTGRTAPPGNHASHQPAPVGDANGVLDDRRIGAHAKLLLEPMVSLRSGSVR